MITVNNIIEAKEIFKDFEDAFDYNCDDHFFFVPTYLKLSDAIEKNKFPIEIDEYWFDGNRMMTENTFF